MARIQRWRVGLSAFVGSPGVMTFYFIDAGAAHTAMQNFVDSMGAHFASGVQQTPEAGGDVIEATDGKIVDTWATAAIITVPAFGGTDYAAPAGIAIDWLTPAFVAGRRLRGRTFIVPGAPSMYAGGGGLNDAILTSMRTEVANLVTAAANNMVVWSRPFLGSPATATKAARPARVGSFAFVTGSRITDKIAVLRSRRD